MTDWPIFPLSEVVALRRGHDLPARDRRPGRVPVISSGKSEGCHDTAVAGGPGVVIGRATNIGRPKWVDGPYWPHNTTLYVTDFKGNIPRWIFHLFEYVDLSGFNSGSVQTMLNRNYIAKVRVAVPTIEEQRRIAGVLGALDDLIDTNLAQADRLIELARVEYDLMQASAPDVVPYDSTVTVLTGGTPKTSTPEYWGGPIPWYSVIDAPGAVNPWVLTTSKFITQEGVDNSAAQVLPVGTTIMSARGTVGKLALVGTPMAMNQSCYGLQSKSGRRGIYGYFAAQDVVDELRQHAHGSVFDTITKDSLSRVSVARPERSAIEHFEDAASPLFDLARDLAIEVADLTRTRDELLPLLMSGRVRVSEGVTVA